MSEERIVYTNENTGTQLVEILTERGGNYGDFEDNSIITQGLNKVVRASPKWDSLPPFFQTAIEVIFQKISRIVEGKHTYEDSWLDIAGYAEVVRLRIPRLIQREKERLTGNQSSTTKDYE